MKTSSLLGLVILTSILFFSSCSKVSNSKIKGEWNVAYFKAVIVTSDPNDPQNDSRFEQELIGGYLIQSNYLNNVLTSVDSIIVSSYVYDFQSKGVLNITGVFMMDDSNGNLVPQPLLSTGNWESLKNNILQISSNGQPGIDYTINSISNTEMNLSGNSVVTNGPYSYTQTYELQLKK